MKLISSTEKSSSLASSGTQTGIKSGDDHTRYNPTIIKLPDVILKPQWEVNQVIQGVCGLTGPAESQVIGYYCHAEVGSLTGTLRACKCVCVGDNQSIYCQTLMNKTHYIVKMGL